MNIFRWLFLGPRRLRRTSFLISGLIAVTLFNLYLINSESFLHDQIIPREDGKTLYIPAVDFRDLDTNFQFSLRGRIFVLNGYSQPEANNSISRRGSDKGQESRNEREKISRPHLALLTDDDVARTENEGKSLPDSVSTINTTTKERNQHFCKDFFLTSANKQTYGTCEPHKPTADACKLAETLYHYDPSLSECKRNQVEDSEICTLGTEAVRKRTVLKAKCKDRVCKRFQNEGSKFKRISLTFGVYTIDPEDGYLKSERNFSKLSELETQLPRIAFLTMRNKFNFVFVKCFDDNNQTLISQLISVPPVITTEEGPKQRAKNTINVNMVLLDSVSRPHFYRSLPKTVQAFKRLADTSNNSSARVFDFELFQAVHGHTTHNEHALFTGQLLPPIDPEEDPPSVKPEVLFGQFKRAGYQTMWQEDLCWTAGWGLITDLAAKDWEELQTTLKESFVDHTGLTHSSCEVLGSFDIDSPFNGPDGDQICYNRRLQHNYFLQYTEDVLMTISASRMSRPLLSYTTLNVGHDDIGRRIQSLDSDLARYVAAMASDQNTVTIILADHGNTYTEYTTATLEGRFEMFHPCLFVIVPNKVANHLGKDAMTALEANQRRLVTMIDLHHSLMALAGPIPIFVKPAGLFSLISPNRTCNDVELRTPNLCVCEGWDSPTTNDSLKISIVEFAVGELNNLMLAQFNKSINSRTNEYPVLRACQRLRPLRFENVRERSSQSDGALITSFDIYFQAGSVVKHEEDIFHVEVKSKETVNLYSLEMELIHFDRLTLFGKYSACADYGVQLKLCICSERKDHEKRITKLHKAPWADYTTFLLQGAKIRNIGSIECLFLVKRNHSLGQSLAFEVANTCPDENFQLEISAEFKNLRLSRKLPFEMIVQAGSIKFAFSAQIEINYWDTYLEVIANV